jgi:O-acetyl-ADP-ribose deacetylase (regulator of RNase III)
LPEVPKNALGFPLEPASRIALRVITNFLSRDTIVKKISVVCYDRRNSECYLATLRDSSNGVPPEPGDPRPAQ